MKNESVKKPVEYHCSGCCAKQIRETEKCICDQMRDGIITIFIGIHNNPNWICRRCQSKRAQMSQG